VDVCFHCPTCDRPARVSVRTAIDWRCPTCDHRGRFKAADPALPCCVVCGNAELYKQKDFPHWLGMTILVVACIASVLTYLWYEKWLTWAILIGSALIDGALYLSVGDAVVCYRCGAYYKGFKPSPAHRPFELTLGERYRQERIRSEQIRQRGQNSAPGAR
jgi:uncharacterized protein (DUF983 family)